MARFSVKTQIALAGAALIALAVLALFAFRGSAQGATTTCATNSDQGRLCVSVTDTPDPWRGSGRIAYPDTLVGTDSHTTMINALGVLGYGVGGIEAEAVLLGQPLYQPMPRIVGVRLRG